MPRCAIFNFSVLFLENQLVTPIRSSNQRGFARNGSGKTAPNFHHIAPNQRRVYKPNSDSEIRITHTLGHPAIRTTSCKSRHNKNYCVYPIPH